MQSQFKVPKENLHTLLLVKLLKKKKDEYQGNKQVYLRPAVGNEGPDQLQRG